MAAFPEPNAFLHVITNYDIAQVANLWNARTNKKGPTSNFMCPGHWFRLFPYLYNLGQSDRYIFQLDNLEKRILSKACFPLIIYGLIATQLHTVFFLYRWSKFQAMPWLVIHLTTFSWKLKDKISVFFYKILFFFFLLFIDTRMYFFSQNALFYLPRAQMCLSSSAS